MSDFAVVDMHEFEADFARVDLIQHSDHLVELHRLTLGKEMRRDFFLKVFCTKSEAFQIEAWVDRRFEAEGIDPGLRVADCTVAINQAHEAGAERGVDLSDSQRLWIFLAETRRDSFCSRRRRGGAGSGGRSTFRSFLLQAGSAKLEALEKRRPGGLDRAWIGRPLGILFVKEIGVQPW